MKRIILSRKGFDSSAGGKASPIFKDHRIFSLPIPQKEESPTKYEDLYSNGITGSEALREASVTKVKENDFCHYDPALNDEMGIFGQAHTAQGELRNNGVDVGDLFLFFGWFKQYASRRRGSHHIFGWLQISEIISGDENIKKYLDFRNINHPHGYGSKEYTNNTLYISSKNLTLEKEPTGLKGHGLFKNSVEDLILSSPMHTKSIWKLPKTYFKESFESFDDKEGFFMNRRFPTDKKNFLVNTNRGRWQEAVLNCENNPKVIDWAINLISKYG